MRKKFPIAFGALKLGKIENESIKKIWRKAL